MNDLTTEVQELIDRSRQSDLPIDVILGLVARLLRLRHATVTNITTAPGTITISFTS